MNRLERVIRPLVATAVFAASGCTSKPESTPQDKISLFACIDANVNSWCDPGEQPLEGISMRISYFEKSETDVVASEVAGTTGPQGVAVVEGDLPFPELVLPVVVFPENVTLDGQRFCAENVAGKTIQRKETFHYGFSATFLPCKQ